MPAPSTTVISRESPPASSSEIESGTWFVAGFADHGPVDEAVLVRNLAQYVSAFGPRVSYGSLYDALDAFFKEGGSRAYVSRVVGPNPVTATVNLSDGSTNTLRVDAKSPGAWANGASAGLSVTVTHPNSGTFDIAVLLNGVTVEHSPEFATNADAIAWANTQSQYITLTDLGGGDPAAATSNLASGTDDRTNATETEWAAAVARFTKDKGPGQVSMPGRTTDTAHANLLAHAKDFNRHALLDLPDTATVATLTASTLAQRTAAAANGRYGSAWAPWAVIPGVSVGTTRTVPWSAIQAGLIARLEGTGATPNEAAAGENGVSQYAIDLSQPAFTTAQLDTLNDDGVNVARVLYGSPRAYGYRTLVDPVTAPDWIEVTNARLDMLIKAQADVIGERFLFKQIDGRKLEIAKFGGELSGMLIPLYEAGALYGETFQDAARVDTGGQVNTDETIAAQELHAVIAVRMSPFAEHVIIEVAKVPITEALA